MPIYLSAYQRFLLALIVIAGISTAGCTDPVDCSKVNQLEQIPTISLSDYCSPDFLEFSSLSCKAPNQLDLPDFCADDYDFSRIFIIRSKSDTVYLHRYKNFTSDITLEFIVQGKDGYELLNKCDTATTSSLVDVTSIKNQGPGEIYVRVVYKLDNDELLNEGQEASLSFAAFEQPFKYAEKDTDGNPVTPTDCTGKPFSLIVSGDDPEAYAQSLGLPYRVCKCDKEIVEIDLPAGVTLDAVRPKVPREKTKNDTTKVSFNFLITPPTNPLIVEYDDNGEPVDTAKYSYYNDDEINGNNCFLWSEPLASTNVSDPLRVTIIDSGVDKAALGQSITNSFTPLQNMSGCITMGELGYDFVDDDSVPDDETGHGTLVTSVFMNGFSPKMPVSLANYKFIKGNSGTLFDAMCATSSAIQNKSQLINMSWGFAADTIPAVLDKLLKIALKENILIVTSAGNDTSDVLNTPAYWPAAAGQLYPNVFPVASYRLNSGNPVLADFSNHNPASVKLAAIYSFGAIDRDKSRVFPAGTSISAPIVASRLARELKPGDDPLQVLNQMLLSGSFFKEAPALLPYVTDGKYLPIPDPASSCK